MPTTKRVIRQKPAPAAQPQPVPAGRKVRIGEVYELALYGPEYSRGPLLLTRQEHDDLVAVLDVMRGQRPKAKWGDGTQTALITSRELNMFRMVQSVMDELFEKPRKSSLLAPITEEAA